MTRIRTNPFAVVVDGEDGTLMDDHRAEWLRRGGPAVLASRLVVSCGEPNCVEPDHVSMVELRDPDNGLYRAIVVAAIAREKHDDGRPAWGLVLESVGFGRQGVILQPGWYDRLGIEEAPELLEREVLVQRYDDDTVELYAVPEEDEHLPGGLPAWHLVEEVDCDGPDEVECPCGSRWRFGCCHGRS